MTRVPTMTQLGAVIATATLVLIGACSDSMRPGGGGVDPNAEKLRAGLVVSGPLTAQSGASAAGAARDTQLVYVSLPPGTLSGGDSVQLGLAASGIASVSTLMGDGGFDPVALYARADDSLEVAVFTHGMRTVVRSRVPALRQPSVIRTSPARGRTDVPLNQQITIVFSQPVNASTVTSSSIQLTVGGAPVPATLVVQAGQPWVVLLSPSSPLAANTTYDIVVSATVTDVNGAALTAPVTSEFVSGSTTADVASIAVLALGGSYGRSASAVAFATPGGIVAFTAYRISGAGDTLTSATGAPTVWSSSNLGIATIDVVGTATAISTGESSISACVESICGTGTIEVSARQTGISPAELGDLGGGDSRVYGMSGGYVVGFSKLAPTDGGVVCRHAFLWSAERGMEDLGTANQECNSAGWMVNASGDVVGSGDSGWWLWHRGTGIQPIPAPDQIHGWIPGALNSRGEIAFATDSEAALAIWSPITGVHLGVAPVTRVFVNGMNDLGQVIVTERAQPNAQQLRDGDGPWSECGTTAYIWDGIANRIINTLEPRDSVTGRRLSICPYAINNQGVVVGFADREVRETAFRWTPGGGFQYLPPIADGIATWALAVNQAGDATVYLISYAHVGQDSLFNAQSAVWMAAGEVIQLGSLGGFHTFANGINDAHIVAGHSQVGSNAGPQRAVIWDLSGATPSRAAPVTPTIVPGRAAFSPPTPSPRKPPAPSARYRIPTVRP